jgi:squalene-associated FAD-dependent desaturase
VNVTVVGGGLAGLAAALECAENGASVTLLEARPRVGGATFSIERNGYWLDNGQHVALRCCTEYRAFLRRIGVEHLLAVQPRLRIPVLADSGRRATIARNGLPAPLHLAGTLLRYAHLPLRDRLRAFLAAAELRTLDPDDARLDEQTFGAWLRAHGQSERAIATLWDLIALPTLNMHADAASLKLAAKVFRTGLLDAADAADVAVPSVPLQQLHGDPATAALERRGARVLTSARVQAVERDGRGLRVQLGDGADQADAVIVAVPPDAAGKLLPEGVLAPETAEALGASPILNVHVHYDRRVLDEPFAAAVDSPVQWLFDRTDVAGVSEGQLVSISISGADGEIELPLAELRERFAPALERLLPAARDATILDFFVTREPKATLRGAPGTHRFRPGAQTSVPGLFLAGAWTDTGWPATMEGAVRSGIAAARAVLAAPRVTTTPLEHVA